MPEKQDKEARAAELLDQYGTSIYRLACSFVKNTADAEEITQDTILQILKYDPVFETKKQEKGWLMKTCANLSRNRLKSLKRFDHAELDDHLAQPEEKDLSFVWDAVMHLPVDQREAVHLFYAEGYGTAEIAEILNKRESSVRSDLSRARKKLRKILKEAYDFD